MAAALAQRVGIKAELWTEFRLQSSLAIPVIATFCLNFSLQLISQITVGRLGAASLAAAALGNMFCAAFGFSILWGCAAASDTLCSQAFGAKNYPRVGIVSQRGFAIISCMCLPVALVWWNAAPIFRALGQSEEVVVLAVPYVRVLLIGLLPMTAYEVGKRHLQSLGIMMPSVAIGAIAIACNLVLSPSLVYGTRLGFLGAPAATATANWLMCICQTVYFRNHRAINGIARSVKAFFAGLMRSARGGSAAGAAVGAAGAAAVSADRIELGAASDLAEVDLREITPRAPAAVGGAAAGTVAGASAGGRGAASSCTCGGASLSGGAAPGASTAHRHGLTADGTDADVALAIETASWAPPMGTVLPSFAPPAGGGGAGPAIGGWMQQPPTCPVHGGSSSSSSSISGGGSPDASIAQALPSKGSSQLAGSPGTAEGQVAPAKEERMDIDDLIDATLSAGFSLKHAFTLAGWREYLALGAPSAALLFTEWGAYESAAIIAGICGTDVLAAHTIIATTASLSFMPTLGFSVAAGIRIGQLMGDRRVAESRLAYHAAMICDTIFVVLNAIFILAVHQSWAYVFTNDDEVADEVSRYIPLLALYSWTDSWQCITCGVLRGLGKPALGAAANVLSWLVIGLPSAYLLAVTAGWKLKGIWLAFIAAVTVAWVFMAVALLMIDWSKAAEIAHARATQGSTPAASVASVQDSGAAAEGETSKAYAPSASAPAAPTSAPSAA